MADANRFDGPIILETDGSYYQLGTLGARIYGVLADPSGVVAARLGDIAIGAGAIGAWRCTGGTTWATLGIPSAIPVPVADGGTGSGNAAGARANLSVPSIADLAAVDGVLAGHMADLANPHQTSLANLATGTIWDLNSRFSDGTILGSVKPARVLYVDRYATGTYQDGSASYPYRGVGQAVAAATAPSASWRYLVSVRPGTYSEAPFAMRPYVSVASEGGYQTTTLATNNNGAHFVTLAEESELRGFAVEGPIGVGFAALRYATESRALSYVTECVIRKGYYGIWANPIGAEGVLHLQTVGNDYTGTALHTFVRVTGKGIVTCNNVAFMCGDVPAVTTGFEARGADAELTMYGCNFRNAGSTDGLLVDEGARVHLVACTFSRGTNAIHVGPTGASLVQATGTIVRRGGFTGQHLWCESATGTLDFQGPADAAKILIVPGADAPMVLTDRTPGSGGARIIGELWCGTLAESVPLASLTRETAATGWISGGALSYGAGLHVAVAGGTGYVNTGTGVVRVVWAPVAALDVGASVYTYVYVDDTATVHTSLVHPAATTIHLGAAYCNGANVVWLSSQSPPIADIAGLLHDWIKDTIGNLWVSGLATSEVAHPSVHLFTDAGSFYLHDVKQTVGVSANPAVFCTWYFNGAAWVPTPGQTNVDVARYNTGGALAAIPGGKSVKHAWYVGNSGSGPEYHFVYGTTAFADAPTAAAGALPNPPSFFADGSIITAGVVCSDGVADIVSVTDERPLVGSQGSGSTAVGVHGALAGLNADDHGQYLLLGGAAARNPLTGELDAASGILTLPVSAAPAQIKLGSAVWDSVNGWLTVGTGAARTALLNRGAAAAGDLAGTYPAPTVADLTIAGEVQGSTLYYNGANWIALPPGTAGWLLATAGPAANPGWINPAAFIAAGGAASGDLSGTYPGPTVTGLSIVAARGSVLYRGAAGWAILAAGTAGDVLATAGPGADPGWVAPASGTPYALLAGDAARNPVTGAFDFTSGALILPVAVVPAQVVLGSAVWNSTAGTLTVGTGAGRVSLLPNGVAAGGDLGGTLPSPTVTGLSLAGAQGAVVYRAAGGWTTLPAGAAGAVLRTGGAGTDPVWSTVPTITDWTNAQHAHQAAASGAQLDHGLAMVAASLLDDDHPQYLLATGARTGATAAAQSFGANGVKADVVDVATAGAGVKVRGSRDFGNLAADPAPAPAAADGDRYYNTALHMPMVYDGSRAKWLSTVSGTFQFGSSGNVNAGSYYVGFGAQTMSATSGFPAPYNGTIVGIGYTRSDNDAATFDIVEGGVSRATLLSNATVGTSNTLNADFSANGILAVRNQAGGNTTSAAGGWIRVRWRA